MLYAAKSGNKLPTIVQKVYMRLGKKIHEIMNKFFLGTVGRLEMSPVTPPFGTRRA